MAFIAALFLGCATAYADDGRPKPSEVILGCALDLETLECDPQLDTLLPRNSYDESIRISQGKIRLWSAPRSCAEVRSTAELKAREEECGHKASPTGASIAPISNVLKTFKVAEKSFSWVLYEGQGARSIVLDVGTLAATHGWEHGKHIVLELGRQDGKTQAFSFIYGWYIHPYDEKLSLGPFGLFFPTSLFAVGGDAGGLRAALMPLGVGVGTKFASWRAERHLGVAVFTSYTVQTPTLVRGTDRDPKETDDINPLAIAVGGLVDVSGKVYVGYSAVYDFSSESDFRADRGLSADETLPSRWGHYLVLGSPLTDLFK
ncbi:MAG: hypothetical protein AAFN41_06330 [Planctomycetota bacterium]